MILFVRIDRLQQQGAQHHGHALHNRGPIVADLLPEAARAVLLHHDERGACREHRGERRQLEVGMAGRHGRKHAVVACKRHFPIAIQAAEQHVRMRKHNALRTRRRARRKDDLNRVVRGKGAFLAQHGRLARARLVETAHRNGRGQTCFCICRTARNEHAFGKIALLVSQTVVQADEIRLHHCARRAGTLEHERRLFGQVLLVHRHHDGTDLRQAEQAHHELGAGVHLHGHPLARLDAQREEQVGGSVDFLVERAVGKLARRALAILEDEERAVTARVDESRPKASQRFVSYDVGHPSHPSRPSTPRSIPYPHDAAVRPRFAFGRRHRAGARNVRAAHPHPVSPDGGPLKTEPRYGRRAYRKPPAKRMDLIR